MTDDPRSLADQAYQSIVSAGKEINQIRGQSVTRDEVEAAALIARSNLVVALAILAHKAEKTTISLRSFLDQIKEAEEETGGLA